MDTRPPKKPGLTKMVGAGFCITCTVMSAGSMEHHVTCSQPENVRTDGQRRTQRAPHLPSTQREKQELRDNQLFAA